MISTWGVRGLHNVFGDGPTKWPNARKKTIKTIMLWDAPQLIKLINMNDNKCLSPCKSLGKNGDEQS